MVVDMGLLREVQDKEGHFGVEDASSDASFEAFERKTHDLEDHAEQGLVKILSTMPNGMNGHSRFYALRCELTRRGRELVERGR